MDRCGKCINCVRLEKVRQLVLACVNPPFSHGNDDVVQVWNDSLELYPCLSEQVNKDTLEAFLAHSIDDIAEGAARAFFACAWGDVEEEAGRDFPTGTDLMDVAPPTPEGAMHHAMRFIGALEYANNSNLPALFFKAIQADVREDKDVLNDQYATLFGHYMAMEGLGHGVCWWDDHTKFDIKVPNYDGYDVLSGDYTVDGFGKIVSTKDIQSGQ